MNFRQFTILLALIMALAACIFVGQTYAEDKILNTRVDSATIALDKNGNEYVRFIITESRNLSGVQYLKSLPVMAFGGHVAMAKSYKAGDDLKAVVNYRKLADGRESYTILDYIEQPGAD